jgi:hypothetical protein
VHGTYGTLEELAAEQLIDREIAPGTRVQDRLAPTLSPDWP